MRKMKILKKASHLAVALLVVLGIYAGASTAGAAGFDQNTYEVGTPFTHFEAPMFLSANDQPSSSYIAGPGSPLQRLYRDGTEWKIENVTTTIDNPLKGPLDGEIILGPVAAYNDLTKKNYHYFFDPNGSGEDIQATRIVGECTSAAPSDCQDSFQLLECPGGGGTCIRQAPYDMVFGADGNGMAVYGETTDDKRMSILIFNKDTKVFTHHFTPAGVGSFGEHGFDIFIPSVAVDNDGKFHLGYGTADGKIRHAVYDGNVTDSYVGANWKYEDVDTVGAPGIGYAPNVSVAINPTTNKPVLSYHDRSNGSLKHAYYTDSWQTTTIDSGDVGYYSSIRVDGGGIISIAYYDNQNKDLKYAYFKNGKWTTTVLDGGVVSPHVDMEIDGQNRAQIIYPIRNSDDTYKWMNKEISHPETAGQDGGTSDYAQYLLDKGIDPSGQGRFRCGREEVPKQKYEEKALSLRKELEGVAKDKKMDRLGIDGNNWGEYVALYVYCDYPIDALVLYHFFGDVIDPNTNWYVYRNQEKYKKNIFQTPPDYQNKINPDAPRYYAQLRTSLAKEKELAIQIRQELEAKYDLKVAKINAYNWAKIVNAIIYGGYNIDDAARTIVFGGKVVHPWWPKYQWKSSPDYKEYSVKPIPQ